MVNEPVLVPPLFQVV